ncbi:helix-turn-helix domain-containing protein [Echinicola rosea]|uniref:Helix-turn-helix domain-containing protein n=1 Tax=Echinicola rosea TaxID=1807691 RepID=A0ABQ1V1Y6_9BACT|nr:helix-turn-helix domain-containing protein [Echinicola rosea]GGF34424.1 hypothetical protein GCM10011339_23340 [Echinicola rosea]
MELIVSTPEQLRSIIASALEEYGIKHQSPVKSPETKKEKFLTRQEAAKTLKVTLQTLHNWTNSGLLKSYSIGGRVLYRTDEVEAALTEVKTVKY